MSERMEANLHYISRLLVAALLGVTAFFLTRTINKLDTVTDKLGEVTTQQSVIIMQMSNLQGDIEYNRKNIEKLKEKE